jgi:hypothetical protein
MRNTPEKDFWTSVKERVGHYTESPADDTWDKIAGAMTPPVSKPNRSLKIAGVIIALIVCSFTGIGLSDGYNIAETFEQLASSARKESRSSVDEQLKSLKQNPRNTNDQEVEQAARTNPSRVTAENISAPPADKLTRYDELASTTSTMGSNNVATRKKALPSTDRGAAHMTSRTVQISAPTKVVGSSRKVDSDGTQNRSLSAVDNSARDIPAADPNAHAGNTEVTSSNDRTDVPVDTRNHGDQFVHQPETLAHAEVEAPHDERKKGIDLRAPVAADKQPELSQTQKPAKNKKIVHGDLYAILTPSLSFQKIVPKSHDGMEVLGFESPGVMSKARFGIAVDIGYERNISKKLSWYAGLSVYQQKQTLTYTYNSPDQFVLGSDGDGYTLVPLVLTNSFNYNMRNAGVAGGLRYTVKGVGLKHKLGLGLQFQKGIMKSDRESSYNNADASYLNYQLTYRLEMNLRPKFEIFLQPSFTYSFLANENLQEPFQLKPYRAGIGFGIIYHL